MLITSIPSARVQVRVLAAALPQINTRTLPAWALALQFRLAEQKGGAR